jgi:hypothetical protein
LESLTHIQPAINQAFTSSGFLKRYESSSTNLEIGKWWLSSPPENKLPLADRVEIEIVHYLQKHPGCSLAEVDEAICLAFPGLLTPPIDLIETCLDSYAEVSPASSGGWHLRPGESAAARKADLLSTRQLIEGMATLCGYECQGEIPLIWHSHTAGDVFKFFPIASSIISRYVLGDEPVIPRRSILVLPGSRSNLLAYKLKRDPRLAEAVAGGWRFLKFRHLRELAKRADLSAAMLEKEFEEDPPILESPVQMTMF